MFKISSILISGTFFLQIVVKDTHKFRPSSPWEKRFLPEDFQERLSASGVPLNIFYVTSNDAKHLPGGDHDDKGIWITSQNNIPQPHWKCETLCLPNLTLTFVK